MDKQGSFRCSRCGNKFPIETFEYRCECGGTFELDYAFKALPVSKIANRDASLWRYREALPIVEDRNIVSMGEGFTPLIPFSYKGFRNLSLKLDYICPTGSFKDRGSSVLISKLKELGIT